MKIYYLDTTEGKVKESNFTLTDIKRCTPNRSSYTSFLSGSIIYYNEKRICIDKQALEKYYKKMERYSNNTNSM